MHGQGCTSEGGLLGRLYFQRIAIGGEDVQNLLCICGYVLDGRPWLQRRWRPKVLPLHGGSQAADVGETLSAAAAATAQSAL